MTPNRPACRLQRRPTSTVRPRVTHHRRLAILMAAFVAFAAQGQVYKHVGPDGKVFYTDKPPPATAGSVEVKPEIRSRAARPEDDPIYAAMNVYGNETMVETFYRFCRDAVPESEPALREARDRWNARHLALRSTKLTVLHDQFSIDQLRRIAAETEATHREILQKVRLASAKEQSTWCAAAPARFEAQELNPARNPRLVKTLESYKPKAARQ